jgi:hypothetical protein
MSFAAVEVIDEAAERTKDFLLPFSPGTWARLAVLGVLTGTGLSVPTPPVPSAPEGSVDMSTPTAAFSAAPADLALGGVLLLVLGLVAGLFLLSSIAEFVFYRSVVDKEARLLSGFSQYFVPGVSYLAFRVFFVFVVLAGVAAAFLPLALSGVASAAFAVLWVPLVLALVLAWGVFGTVVHDFVLLRMVETGEGLIASLRSVWPDVRSGWREFAVYFILKLAIGAVLGVLTLMVAVSVLVLALIPTVVVAAIGSEVLAVVTVLVGLLVAGVVVVGISVPVQTFVRNYTLVFYNELTG